MTNQVAIMMEDLGRKFEDRQAVDNLNLEINSGEVFGFLGPNGAGKTTTIRMLSALIKPTSGRGTVNGFEIGKDDSQIRSSVGIVTESPGMYDDLTAQFNLEFYADLYHVKNPRAQVEKYLRMLGLWDRRYDEVGSFSKGMRQKLALARSLLHEPPVLFLDEPTSGLDPESAHLVRDFIVSLRKAGHTIFLCTHNLEEADRLCDRIALFKTRLLVVDTPDRLRAQIFGRNIVFQLKEVNETLEQEISSLPFVRDVRVSGNKLVAKVEDPEKNNSMILHKLMSHGAEIQFVGELHHSLEEIYLQLVKEAGI